VPSMKQSASTKKRKINMKKIEKKELVKETIKFGSLPKWTKKVSTGAWSRSKGAINKLENVEAADNEVAHIKLNRHLANLIANQAKRKNRLSSKRKQAQKDQVVQTTSDKGFQFKEATIRRRAKVRGLKLEKERNRGKNPANLKYRLIDASTKIVVFGGNRKAFRATLEECAQYIHPEINMSGQVLSPQQQQSRINLAVKRFGHLEKLSVRQNQNDLRCHGTKNDRIRSVLGYS